MATSGERVGMEDYMRRLHSAAQPAVRAALLAYQRAIAEQGEAMVADRAAVAAYVAAGGTPAVAAREVAAVVAEVTRGSHVAWFWRPAQERIAREQAEMERRGLWPPPKNRRDWPDDLR